MKPPEQDRYHADAGRRRFLERAGRGALFCAACWATATAGGCARKVDGLTRGNRTTNTTPDAGRSAFSESASLALFLCGDVMTARGIDQVLPHPGDTTLHESYSKNALDYVAIAERANGPIPRPVKFDYIWGAALDEFQYMKPDFRVVNLETSITSSDDYWPGKGIHYRMHPGNIACLTAAGIDCCALANNHVLDWGYAGLEETLRKLEDEGIATAGAGPTLADAGEPAILSRKDGRRALVFSFGLPSSGIDSSWAATDDKPGVNLLPDLSTATGRRVGNQVARYKQPGDIVVASIHWGGNWGYEIPAQQQRFARELIDSGGVDAVHGHSSHHPKGIEVYRNRPIIYGCGDLLNDYEGIRGHAGYRTDLALMYFPVFDGSGRLARFTLTPLQIRHFRLQRPTGDDIDWMAAMLNREGSRLGTRIVRQNDTRLRLEWE